MASIGHLAVGAALGAVYSRATGSNPRIAILTFAGLALAPDLDLVTSAFGVPSNTPLDHRGFTHSLPFAMGLGLLVSLALHRRGRGLLAGLLTFGALSSHGFLDSMSERGGGPMLLWPLTTEGYEFLWRPIPGVLTASHYLTMEAIPTLVQEFLLFLPFTIFAALTLFSGAVDKEAAEDAIS